MFLGHFAVALASKRVAPRTSMGWMVACAQLPDALFPSFLLLGWEKMHVVDGANPFLRLYFDAYPFTHSLTMNAACGAAIGLLYWWRTRYARGAWTLALLVMSHWVLDVLTHRVDMPLYPGGPKLGLGLWHSVAATIAVETALFAASIWVYVKGTWPLDRVGRWALVTFAAMLALMYAGSIAGPPPKNSEEFALVAPAVVLLPLWSWWFDRHRRAGAAILTS